MSRFFDGAFWILCYTILSSSILIAFVRFLLIKTKRDFFHFLILLAFFLLVVGATFFKLFPELNDITQDLLSFMGVAAICLLIYATPSFSMSISMAKSNIIKLVLPYLSIPMFLALVLFWHTTAKHGIIIVLYTVLFVELIIILIPSKKENAGNSEILDDFWKKMMRFISIASLLYIPFYVLFDVVLVQFYSKTSTIEFFPLFFMSWGIYFIILNINLIKKSSKVLKEIGTLASLNQKEITQKSQQHHTQEMIVSEEKMKYFGLSKREQEAIILLAQGSSYKEIAEKMFVSEATIKTHIARAYIKTDCGSKVAIINKLLKD